jgi:hypothetical protein
MYGVLGSQVGGSATVATTCDATHAKPARAYSDGDTQTRDAHGEFIDECAKLLLDAFTHTLDKPEIVLLLYAVINRIRLPPRHRF